MIYPECADNGGICLTEFTKLQGRAQLSNTIPHYAISGQSYTVRMPRPEWAVVCAYFAQYIPHPFVVQGLELLCHANVGSPSPEPWQEAHQLLSKGLEDYTDSLPAHESSAMRQAAGRLDMDWFSLVLARVHINAFRCDLLHQQSPHIGLNNCSMPCQCKATSPAA